MPSQANAGEPQEMPDVSHELTQSYEHLNADLFSNKNLKANPSSGSSTGTMIYGDDARNAVLQAKQFDGLFGAAERSTPQTIDPDFIDRTSSWCQLPQDWNIPETFSANAPANVIPAFAYQSSPSHAQWSPRAVRAATPEPMYLKPPYPPSQLQQSISFNNGDIRTPSISPANFVSLDHAGSSRTTSVAPPTVMSTPSYISNLSTTTAPAPLIGDSLMCPFPGCHHAPFTGESKKTSLSRHMRDHREKFQCRVGDCTSVIRRSDNRRIHLERLHKSIQLPPKTSNPRKRKGPGGIDKILKCCFVRIQVWRMLWAGKIHIRIPWLYCLDFCPLLENTFRAWSMMAKGLRPWQMTIETTDAWCCLSGWFYVRGLDLHIMGAAGAARAGRTVSEKCELAAQYTRSSTLARCHWQDYA